MAEIKMDKQLYLQTGTARGAQKCSSKRKLKTLNGEGFNDCRTTVE